MDVRFQDMQALISKRPTVEMLAAESAALKTALQTSSQQTQQELNALNLQFCDLQPKFERLSAAHRLQGDSLSTVAVQVTHLENRLSKLKCEVSSDSFSQLQQATAEQLAQISSQLQELPKQRHKTLQQSKMSFSHVTVTPTAHPARSMTPVQVADTEPRPTPLKAVQIIEEVH
jgi:predicted  nucleic acid-binding Zn-ribbon protein